MVYGTSSGAAAAAAIHAAMVRAVKASGVLVRVEPEAFQAILSKNRGALVIASVGGVWRKEYNYLTSYKGFAFFTKSPNGLIFPGDVELINAKQIWMPS
jgi:hypothetical protein